MSAQPPALRVTNLSKHYGQVCALRELSLEVAPGEILGLLGPNGAGKTTTLECLLGLRSPDTGSVHVLGLDIAARPAASRALVGALLQDATLQDALTPREALALFASFHAKPASVADLLQRFQLEEKADAPFRTLSEGQKQRLFLALAFVHNPPLLVLDEPSAGLDPQSRAELHALIRSLRAEGRTIILSTHDIEEAGQLCDRVAILHKGSLVALDSPAALIARSKAAPRLDLRTLQPLPEALLAALPGAETQEALGSRASVRTREPNAALMSLARQLEDTGNQLLDLQITRPSLEDVFLELTGSIFEERIEEREARSERASA